MGRRVSGCVQSGKGWYRWYKGRTRYVCPADTPDAEVESRWVDLRRVLDGEAVSLARRPLGTTAYRDVLGAFLSAQEHRVKTGKPRPLKPRTLANYTTDLNEFGRVIGGATLIREVGPDQFARYVQSVSHNAPAGFDSKVAHVRTLFKWAVDNEYVDRVRYGTAFARPGKQAIRDERIGKPKGFTAEQVAKLIDAAQGTMRVMLMLGIAAAMNNSEIAGLERACVDLDTGVIDFRRRKTGRVRRVIPLPPAVVSELRAYRRPEPADKRDDGLFFLTVEGNPYVRMTSAGVQANTITILFRKLAGAAGVKTLAKGQADGKGFAGLRTTFVNLAPPGYREEVELITGHAKGTVLLDHYLEDVGLDRLRHVVSTVWGQVAPLLTMPLAEVSPDDADALRGSNEPGAFG